MDEGGTAKAPVTRLRRRLSVEAEEVKSPSGVTTPTKKRGGRLAAKPQLDLIDENETEVSSKRVTRKTAAKAVIEPAEEKETLTPSRRSARIKSNSSIISETTNVDSPRAKRAARRLSQAGSDNETSTPVRQTRRTRKDSTSSIDKQVDSNAITKTPNISQTIVEETNNGDTETNSIVRKSPRLVEKKENIDTVDKPTININDSDRKGNVHNDGHNENQKVAKETIQVTESSVTDNPVITNNELDTTIKNKDQPTDEPNDSSDNLLIALDENPQKIGSIKNKSCTALDSSNTFSTKRNRTKSWTSAAIDHSNYDNFYSDNETSKKKRERKNNTKPLNNTGSGDNELFTKKRGKNQSLDKGKENISTLSVKENSFTANSIKGNKNGDLSKNINSDHSSLESPKKTDTSKITEKDMLSRSTVAVDPSPVAELFNNAPGIHVRSLIFVDEDSDSNTDIVSKNKKSDIQDQCVPIVHQIDGDDNLKSNISFEPMDIDETLPENVNNVHENNTASLSQYNKRKSSISIDENRVAIDNVNKSTRKYSGTYLESQNLEKSNNENKSTLILSQIKDTSSNEINTSTKTPKLNNNDQLSKSVSAFEIAKNKETNTANLSQNYLTSTPLQQKVFPKLGIQLDTSLMSPKNVSNKKIDTKNLSRDHNISTTEPDNNKEEQEVSLTRKSRNDSEQSTSEEESETETSGKQNSMIDDEVEDAGDDYESGDSQNEEDREYEKNNEILEKGETLETEEDFSDDSDYEKDSFVVSSADEDNELLSGSGDNLSMSDNELTMSSKSKKKYNERKDKEQKKASREMYNARHRLNESQTSEDKPKIKKNKRQRLDSSALKSDDEQIISQENNKTDLVECDENDISRKKKKKVKSLSESVEEPEIEKEIISNDSPVKKKKKVKSFLDSECDEEPDNENEITIFNTSNIVKEDPLLVHVKEEIKSPRKSLNISTIAISDAVEEINVNENMSVTHVNDSLDPLQATAGIDDEEGSSISENEEIMENYDSILKDLNKNTNNIKSSDISLNEDKHKKKTKERVFDEFNLTLTKTKKNKQKSLENVKNEEILQSEFQKKADQSIEQNEDDKASDSIDMRLLFPEDSNDSEHNSDNVKRNTNTDNPVPEYIPLKNKEDKTNLRASTDDESNDHLDFFIDTKGTRNEDTSQDTSIKRSAKKSKNKNNTSILLNTETDELPVEITCTSEKKKKNRVSLQSGSNICEDFTQEDVEMNIKSSGKKNKKTKLSFGTSIDEITTQIDFKDLDEIPAEMNNVVHSDKKKKKHSKKHTDHNDSAITEIQTTELIISGEVSGELEPTSAIKKKKKAKRSLNSSSVEIVDTDVPELDEAPVEVMYQSNKKKKHSIDKNQSNIEVGFTQLENTAPEEAPANISSGKKKKKSKILQDSFNEPPKSSEKKDDLNEEAPDEVVYQSNKKKKHREGNLQSHIEAETVELEDTAPEQDTLDISSTKKKKKSKMSQDSFNKSSTCTGKEATEGTEIETSYESHKKKKHTKQFVDIASDNAQMDNKYSGDTLSLSATTSSGSPKKISKSNSAVKQTQLETSPDDAVGKEAFTSKKRKREILPEFIPIESNPISENTSILLQENERKKRKTFQNNEDKGITEKKYKKRKERDDEHSTEVSKVFKQSSSDKVYIQRLPSHILNQLEDKPRKDTTEKKKPKVISTTEFTVEDQRKIKRNKPSNYLEESVYLNDSPILKKEKKSLKKPKVLPFIPTASTSDEGFTTNFRINILPGDNQFIAQSTNVTDFRTESLHASKLKKFRTFEKYKTQRKYKISKF